MRTRDRCGKLHSGPFLIPWIEHLVPGESEEAPVGVKGSLQQLAEELSEQATPVNPCFVQACGIFVIITFSDSDLFSNLKSNQHFAKRISLTCSIH